MHNKEELIISERTRMVLNVFVLVFSTTFLVFIPAGFPYREDYYFLFSTPAGILFFFSAAWVIYGKPSPYINYTLQISGTSSTALVAYRCLIYPFPQISLFLGIFVVLGFLFVHTLPIWNFPMALFIHNELYMPKTWIGKFVFRAFLYAAPFGAIGGATLGRIMAGSENLNFNKVVAFFMGILILYLTFSIPFIRWSQSSVKGYRHPIQDVLERKEAITPVENAFRQSSRIRKRASRIEKK